MKQAAAIQRALEELERMPGVGPKSAQRILNWLLMGDESSAKRLGEAIIEVKQAIHMCPKCHNFAQEETCEVCRDVKRDMSKICVVAEPRDIEAIERTGVYQGLYHVLGGVIDPMAGILPEDLYISDLMARLGSEDIVEVVLATNPNVEGETTASYIARMIKPLEITVTRLASGLPVGGELEYADEVTLGRAIESRQEI